MKVIINPGTGCITGTNNVRSAEKNIKQFLRDVNCKGPVSYVRSPDKDYGEGRYCFLISNGYKTDEIQMPGLPIERVRFTGDNNQNIWDYPRLYINGSSFVWKYAVSLAFNEDE